MALSSSNAINEIAEALGNPGKHANFLIDKATLSGAASGQFFSLWRAAGEPPQGAIPSTAAIPNSLTLGSLNFTNQTAPAAIYHAYQQIIASNAGTSLEFHDRLAHMGGLSGTVTTAQGALSLTGLSADRLGNTDYSSVNWWLEWYTDTGATNVNATVNVTYNDDSTGNLAAIALGATARASRLFPLISAVAGKYIKAVNSVTLSATTGTAGNFGITATRRVSGISTVTAQNLAVADWAQLGLGKVENDACIMMVATCTATTTGTFRGQGKLIYV